MFSSVWETIVPEHDGQVLARSPGPPRDDQRARRLAEAGRQRRGHQHADERALQRRRTASPARSGSAARRIACQENARSDHRRAHQRRGRAAPRSGWSAAARRRCCASPIRCSAEQREHDAAERDRREPDRGAATRTRAGAPCRPAASGSRLGRLRARARGLRSAGGTPDPHGGALHGARGCGHGDRVLVGAPAPRRRRAARRSARALARPRPGPSARGARAPRQRSRSASASALRRRRRDEHAVDAVAHHVAVAGDVRGDDRRAGGERLGQHHAEALAAERRRAQHVGGLELRGACSRRRPCPSIAHVARVEHQRRDLLGRRRRSPSARSGCARAAPRRRAAAPAGPCARPPGRRTRSAGGRPAAASRASAARCASHVRRRWG